MQDHGRSVKLWDQELNPMLRPRLMPTVKQDSLVLCFLVAECQSPDTKVDGWREHNVGWGLWTIWARSYTIRASWLIPYFSTNALIESGPECHYGGKPGTLCHSPFYTLQGVPPSTVFLTFLYFILTLITLQLGFAKLPVRLAILPLQ
jgi:hypothetical protein